ncbi:LOW QUALITY PROTEIN: steroid receptor-associated and regulated protein [Mus pahari]|uniref:LOW QUALITY PROTEIN: steroid receptor-associated and regulated protein n=1 Tax=Mus pahari TaxID=10093 RepID=UPI000A309EA6|nr:LOW QUALITY PROTEIN: steroid receptor-associated and regulated protein [Mus pahari]
MASSKDPRNWRASLKDFSVETSSGIQPVCAPTAVPTAHVTFIIDCANGKQVSLAASAAAPPHASRANQGCVAGPMKTFVMFRGETTLLGTQNIPLSRRPLDGVKDTLPPYRGLGAPHPLPASLPGPQNDPEAKGSSLERGATEKHSTREKVKHSLKALTCLCGQVE